MATLVKSSPIFLRGLSLFIWMGVIFFFSSLSGNGHSDTSFSYYIERKSAHVIEYAILMFLSVQFVMALFPKETLKKVFLLAGTFSVASGATDELHQFFVPYRGAMLSDVLVDSFGVLLMGILFWFIIDTRKQKK